MITGLETIDMSFIAIGTIASESRRIESFPSGISEVAGPDILGHPCRIGVMADGSARVESIKPGNGHGVVATDDADCCREKRMSPAYRSGSSRERINQPHHSR